MLPAIWNGAAPKQTAGSHDYPRARFFQEVTGQLVQDKRMKVVASTTEKKTSPTRRHDMSKNSVDDCQAPDGSRSPLFQRNSTVHARSHPWHDSFATAPWPS